MMAPGESRGGLWGPAIMLCRREVVRFLRQRSRIIGALGAPLVFWVLIGSGAGTSFTPPGAEGGDVPYLEYFYPGVLVMILLFTAVFSTISIIEDRQDGFLQGVLAAPVPRTSIVAGKVAGSTVLAALHAVVFLALAPYAGFSLTWWRVLLTIPVLLCVASALSALGFLIAWRMESTQGFHTIMNMGLVPMWVLSGALFPAAGAESWVKVIMYLNPLTYGVMALRGVLYLGTDAPVPDGPGLVVSLLITVLATVGICAVAVQRARRPLAAGD